MAKWVSKEPHQWAQYEYGIKNLILETHFDKKKVGHQPLVYTGGIFWYYWECGSSTTTQYIYKKN